MATRDGDPTITTRTDGPALADLPPMVKTSSRSTPDPSSPPGCDWCGQPLPYGRRSDIRFCNQRCRQSAWRFGRDRRRRVASSSPRRLAYADPPYPGLSARYYADHPDFAGEVDHVELLERLSGYDGWALSTSAVALPGLIRIAPHDARVAAWFRGERPTRSYAPLSAWEPVIYRPARAYLAEIPNRRLDALVHHSRPRSSDPNRVIGTKPAAFIWWLFDLLAALPGDTLDDLYPGSGGVTRAWDLYTSGRAGATRQQPLPGL